jgi:FdhD protein
MMDATETFHITRFSETTQEQIEATVARERPLTIIVNNQELVTLLCSPSDLKALAVGFLASEGLIKHKNDLKQILLDERRGIVRIQTTTDIERTEDQVFKRFITTGCGRGATFYSPADVQEEIVVDAPTTMTVIEVFQLVQTFLRTSDMYKTTGGVHSAALCSTTELLVFMDDVGRHNALDKIFGRCLLGGLDPEGKMMISTGRISSEMLLKVAKRNVPIVMSKSAPTALGVHLAEKVGLTLIGFVRGKRMNVYTHPQRIIVE